MKKIIIALTLLFVSLTLMPQEAAIAQVNNPPISVEPYSGKPLCAPAIYLSDPVDCLPLGPSQYLTDLARKGITLPLKPLPAATPPDSLNDVPVKFAKVNVSWPEQATYYGSFEDAIAGNNPVGYLSGEFLYVSYIDSRQNNGGQYLQLKDGRWLRASPTNYVRYQGLVFNHMPANAFGWIVDSTYARSQPTYMAPEVGEVLPPEISVQVYDIIEADGTQWYMIGIDQWVERLKIRVIKANPTPPEGVDTNRWIEVNLFEQILSVYDNGQLVFATLISTGSEPYFTQPGLFQIYQKLEYEFMRGSFTADKSDFYSLEDVPYTMYFDQARALHGAYWRPRFGYPMTHGCVNLSVGDSNWLYQWANVGDWVYVWDPSGATPTDPAFYGAGGA